LFAVVSDAGIRLLTTPLVRIAFLCARKLKVMTRVLAIMMVFFTFPVMAQTDVLSPKERDATMNKLTKRDDKDTTYWKKGGILGLNASQVSLTNWAGGGQSSISGAALVSLFSNYKKQKRNWDSTLDLGYGLVHQNGVTFKSDDKIDLATKYGHQASKYWYYTGMFTFRSQFAPGYKNPGDTLKISKFLAPAYMIGSLGMDFKPREGFNIFISPVTAKVTIVNDRELADAGSFGVEAAEYDALGNKVKNGRFSRYEVGGFIKILYTQKIMENITLTTKADLFSNYLVNPQNIDVNWETLISMKVNKFITVSLTTHLIYDDDIDIQVDNNDDGVIDAIGPRTQFKQVLAVGFSYKF
jgi:hypothetical protein